MEIEIFSNDTYQLRIDGKDSFKLYPKNFLDDFVEVKKPSKINLDNSKFQFKTDYLSYNVTSLYDSEIMKSVLKYYKENKYDSVDEQPEVSGERL